MHSRRSLEHLLMAAHVALIAFSTVAMLTILAGAPGPWLQQEPNATVMRVAFAYTGPLYVVLGALAAHAFLGARLGWRKATALAVAASVISLASELAGTSTGLPFGEYHYTPLLGYRILGLVPFPIPISWFYMLVGCLVIVSRLRPAADDGASRWKWAMWAGTVLLAWDIAMDPAMVRTGHWVWGAGASFRDSGLPEWIVSFFTRDRFYGMPLSNWMGWWITGTVVARVMLWIVPPVSIVSALSRSTLPIALYLANGVMPVALCFRDRLWWAAILGALAMLFPALLALRAPTPTTATASTARSLHEQPA